MAAPLPPGWTVVRRRGPTHPYQIRDADGADLISCESADEAAETAWALWLEREPTDPPAPEYIRALCDRLGGQREAARRLRTDERTVRRWVAGERGVPWAVAELLRRMVSE